MGDDSSDDPQYRTTTTTNVLGPEQKALVGAAMPNWMQFARAPYNLPGRAGVAGFTPAEQQGQESLLQAANQQSSLLGKAGLTNEFFTSGALLDPNTNPGLQRTIEAGTRPIWQGLTEQVLPNIRSGAAFGSGGAPSANYGGSRQGIAEGIASRGALDAAGDVGGKIAFQGYNTGLDATLKALGMTPQMAASYTIPGLTQSGVGAQQRGMEQSLLSADQQAAQFAWMLPFIRAQALTSGAAATGGGSNVSVGPPVQGPSTTDQIIGGATVAASLAPFVLSDMRLKTDIVQIGRLFDGTPVYRFRYAGNDAVHVGLMAQDVELFAPEAVKEFGKYKFVNYDLATRRAMESGNELP